MARQSIAHLFTYACKLDTPHRISPSVSGGPVKRLSGFKSQPAHTIYWQVFVFCVLSQSMLHPLPSTSFPIQDSLAILQCDLRHWQTRTAERTFCTAVLFAFQAQSLSVSKVSWRGHLQLALLGFWILSINPPLIHLAALLTLTAWCSKSAILSSFIFHSFVWAPLQQKSGREVCKAPRVTQARTRFVTVSEGQTLILPILLQSIIVDPLTVLLI